MLSLRDVSVAYDGISAVVDVDLELSDGQVLAVLGPSGCGKSTLLRAIAGLEPLSAGSVSWDGADLGGVPTHKRGFALLFQDGQLFAHLTVARNVGYALRLRRAANTRARVDELLELVGLAGFGDRLPATLSGGERQRVALARALAAEPRLLLLDEPLSALDAGLRERLAADLRDILRAAGTTALMVTHDHDEAFRVADRLAVMRAGRVVQEGPIAEVWREPADPETALFLGYARVFRDAAAAAILTAAGREPAPAVAVRRSALSVDPRGALTGLVRSSRATPEQIRLVVDVTGVGEADAVAPLDAHPAIGQTVQLAVDPGRLAIWVVAANTPRLTAVYRRAYALLVGIAVVMGGLALTAAISIDRSLVDPEGFLGPSWLRLPLLLVGAFALDLVPRTLWLSKFKPAAMPAIFMARVRTHWTRERCTLVVVGLVCFYTTYVSYRNLKSFLPFVMGDTKYDRTLHLVDRLLVFGHEPGLLLHNVLGTGIAAHFLSYIYLWFLPLVPLALTAWLIWSRNITYGYWFATSQSIAWSLGTLSYYALPTLGPGPDVPVDLHRPPRHPDVGADGDAGRHPPTGGPRRPGRRRAVDRRLRQPAHRHHAAGRADGAVHPAQQDPEVGLLAQLRRHGDRHHLLRLALHRRRHRRRDDRPGRLLRRRHRQRAEVRATWPGLPPHGRLLPGPRPRRLSRVGTSALSMHAESAHLRLGDWRGTHSVGRQTATRRPLGAQMCRLG